MPESRPLDLGFVLVAAGAAVTSVSTFLPLLESTTTNPIQHNTLIQRGGWSLIFTSVLAAVLAFQALSGRRHRPPWPWCAVLVALAALFVLGKATEDHTLYPIRPDGTTDTSGGGTHGSLGIAIYAAWIGVGLMVAGVVVAVRKTAGASPAPDQSAEPESTRDWLDRIKPQRKPRP